MGDFDHDRFAKSLRWSALFAVLVSVGSGATLTSCGTSTCEALAEICAFCDDVAEATACSAVVSEGDANACTAVTGAYLDECDVRYDMDGNVVSDSTTPSNSSGGDESMEAGFGPSGT